MMGSLELYAALQAELPGCSATKIGLQVGLAHSTISKLANGNGVCEKAAKWLADRDGKYAYLHKEALIQMEESNTKKGKREDEQVRDVDLSALPRHIQQFCGYVS